MTVLQWFIFFLIVQVVHFAGTWKLYEAAGRKRWEAAIPVYNAVVLMKIINRPTWWTILLFVPIVNLIMFPVVWVETLRSFGKNSTADTLLGIFTFGFYIYYVNYTQTLNHIPDRSLMARTKVGDTVSSLLFAIVVATLVHTYVMQPFTIPTSSLEKSLLVGDFLFVSKFHYGARTPMTAVALPMVHDSVPLTPKLSDSIPFLDKRSYAKWPQLPSFRLPGFEDVERNDIVVFNWPVDTVVKFFDASTPRVWKPIDKKSNYVKRCVGIPGDSLSVREGFVFINGKELVLPERAKPQYIYDAYSKKGVSLDLVRAAGSTEYDRTFEISQPTQEQGEAMRKYLTGFEPLGNGMFRIKTDQNGIPDQILREFNIALNEVWDYHTRVNLTMKGAEELRAKKADIDSLVRIILPKAKSGVTEMFPKNTTNWSLDNFGPIYVPQEGKTVALTLASLPFYKKIITEYEGNKLDVSGDQIKVNGQVATSYTFKQNYYWMMGDNRHKSEDSRYWGFVPENHIVGKPVFIWMSLDGSASGLDKIRWERMFTTVGGDGEPYSYFKFFLIALGLYFVAGFFVKKKAKS
ncbi:MAG: signal peptidase I [Flavobacterium sp.]|uniref:signal peptidase I n=1 Tax=Flavobacterium sp. TaxID=239 RepID=UPI001218926D|nr:signal peptidase I [Flavobacterium sp.]RZJ67063.1 MAG: signal peptidase I [Flavobacterium sp.]